MLTQFGAGRYRVVGRRLHPAGEVTQLVQEMRACLLALQREQLLELIEDQHRREQEVVTPELGGLEETPQRLRPHRHMLAEGQHRKGSMDF
jgi:hypothetical protein